MLDMPGDAMTPTRASKRIRQMPRQQQQDTENSDHASVHKDCSLHDIPVPTPSPVPARTHQQLAAKPSQEAEPPGQGRGDTAADAHTVTLHDAGPLPRMVADQLSLRVGVIFDCILILCMQPAFSIQ